MPRKPGPHAAIVPSAHHCGLLSKSTGRLYHFARAVIRRQSDRKATILLQTSHGGAWPAGVDPPVSRSGQLERWRGLRLARRSASPPHKRGPSTDSPPPRKDIAPAHAMTLATPTVGRGTSSMGHDQCSLCLSTEHRRISDHAAAMAIGGGAEVGGVLAEQCEVEDVPPSLKTCRTISPGGLQRASKQDPVF
jgi:hypothetical protein